MRHDDLDISLDHDRDLDPMPPTLRFDAPTIPPEAKPIDDDTPTLVVVPSALAALAERSMETVPAMRPRRDPADAEDEELALRRMVYGIWAIAALLMATLVVLIK